MEHQIQESWFKRNWLWFVPTMGCVTIIVLFFMGIGALFFGVTNMMSDATPTKYALEVASKNPIVIERLGNPIEQKGMISGNISFKNSDGNADLKISIIGEKGKGVIRVLAEKYDNEWDYKELYVFVKETNEKINLIDKSLEGI